MKEIIRHKSAGAVVGLQVAVIALVTFGASVVHAQPGTVMKALNADGWHAWPVEAVANAPHMCCGVWDNNRVTGKTCNLDSPRLSYGSVGQNDAAIKRASSTVQVYAKVENGKATRIHTLSSNCEVQTDTPIRRHANIGGADSIAWLGSLLNPRTKLSAQALQSISMHEGSDARNLLVATAQANQNTDNRKEAVFWMGQVRVQETFRDIERILQTDPSSAVREHAIFSLAQSNHTARSETISRAGQTDADPAVRGKAWFWLAQSDDQNAERLIMAALDLEKNQSVRNEAIFALSQFSDQRAAKALINIIENRRYSDKDRKQALFWLSQSDSDEASRYLSSVFDD